MSLAWSVLTPFLAAAFVPVLGKCSGRRVGYLVALVPLGLAVWFAGFIGHIDTAPVINWPWVPQMGLSFYLRLTGLGLLFLLLITGIGFLVTLYSIAYLSEHEDLNRFYAYLLIFMGAMMGLVLARNILLLYMFWELTSIASFLLIGFWYTREESSQGALKALLITVAGGFCMLVAILLLSKVGGSLVWDDLILAREVIHASPYYPWIVILLLIGAFTKSAQVPFHIWLPGAMAAPTPVSAYLHSATMVKAGVFLVAQFSLLLGGTPLWLYLIGIAGAVTMLVGSWLAIQQTDLKALLAFSTISQLGLILPAFALGTPEGAAAGAFHVLNHAIFKGALFLLVGVIDHVTHTRDVGQISGLLNKMPVTATLMGIAALSMAGVPFLSGFASKEMIFAAYIDFHWGGAIFRYILVFASMVASSLTVVYSLVLVHRIHFGPLRYPQGAEPKDPSPLMLFGPVLMVLLVLAFGLRPSLGDAVVGAASSDVLGSEVKAHLTFWHGLAPALSISMIAIVLGLLGYLQLEKLQRLALATRTRWNANTVYSEILVGLVKTAKAVTNAHFTGFLRDYLVFMTVGIVLMVSIGVGLRAGSLNLQHMWSPVSFLTVAVVTTAAMAALIITGVKRRIVAIVVLGIVDVMISLLWVLLGAPDLALTQLMVEAVSVILLFVAFAKLPALPWEGDGPTTKTVNVLVSIVFGVFVASLGYVANEYRLAPGIGILFNSTNIELSGGHNAVNVILVDFRALDTVGEITVLSIVAIGIYSLITLRLKGKG